MVSQAASLVRGDDDGIAVNRANWPITTRSFRRLLHAIVDRDTASIFCNGDDSGVTASSLYEDCIQWVKGVVHHVPLALYERIFAQGQLIEKTRKAFCSGRMCQLLCDCR